MMRLSTRARRRGGDHRPQESSPPPERAEGAAATAPGSEAPPFVATRRAGAWDLVELAGPADGSGEAVRFVGDVRATLEQLSAVSVDFGIGSARASLAASVTGGELERMREGLEAVVATMSALREASKDTADSSTRSAELAEQLAAETETGLATLGSVIDAIDVMKDQGDGVAALVERLATELNNIGAISSIIDGVASQTKLLALNAAIEAARAGEHGRGFAVVADEVGRLAANTASQTAQIAETVEATRRELGAVQVATRQSGERAQASVQDAAQARSALERMRELVHRSTEPTAQVAAAAQEQLAELESVAGHLDEAARAAGTIEDQARAVREQTRDLSAKTEDASEALGRFDIGSFLDRVYRLAEGLSLELGAILEHAVDSGRVTLAQVLALQYEEIRGPDIRRLARLFDVSRASTSGFEPPKFRTAYDELVDEAMMAVMDRCLAEEPRLEFALPIDLNSYAPAHNRRYSQAITGDPVRDLAANRTKRFFLDSDALLRAARMELPPTLPARVLTRPEIERAGVRLTPPRGDERRFLLQTYARDTGALLSVVTVPLYVKDQRYGSVIAGWNPAA